MRYDYSNPQGYLSNIESRSNRVKRRKKPFFSSFVLFFVVFGILVYLIQRLSLYSPQVAKVVTPVVKPITQSVEGIVTHSQDLGLQKVVTQSLAGTQGEYGIYIKNLKTGEEYTQNEHEVFETASLYKLWVMAVVEEDIHNGSLKPTDELDASVEDLNQEFDIASEEAELTDGDIDTTVQNALTQMITISNNYSALILTDKIQLSSLNNFLREYNFSESKAGSPPTSTPADIEKFFDMLYKGEIVSPEYSQQMLDLLKQQQINDRIPKYLPQRTVVAHKTGELDGYKHDAGIVYTPKGDYIFVAMSNSNDPLSAAERIALLSKAVYDYFQSN